MKAAEIRKKRPRPPHNDSKIRRPTSGFGRLLIFRSLLSVRPEVADSVQLSTTSFLNMNWT
eukprot:4317118-Pleurochrysis_carterae.AAC.1